MQWKVHSEFRHAFHGLCYSFNRGNTCCATHARNVQRNWLGHDFTTSVATGHGIAVNDIPITRIHGEASAPTGAHPADLIPALAALRSGVDSLHLAGALASLSFHSGHGFWFIVVNINPLCWLDYLSGAKSSNPAQMSKPRNRHGNTWPNWTTGGCSPLWSGSAGTTLNP